MPARITIEGAHQDSHRDLMWVQRRLMQRQQRRPQESAARRIILQAGHRLLHHRLRSRTAVPRSLDCHAEGCPSDGALQCCHCRDNATHPTHSGFGPSSYKATVMLAHRLCSHT